MTRQTKQRLAFALVGVLLTSAAARADVIVDQAFDPRPGVDLSVSVHPTDLGALLIGYSFPVFTTGVLTAVDVLLNHHVLQASGNVEVEIRAVTNGAPVRDASLALATGLITPSMVPFEAGPQFVHIDLSGLALVAAGTHVAVVLRPLPGSGYAWVGRTGNPYAGALVSGFEDTRECGPGDTGPCVRWSRSDDLDVGFRSYVLTEAAPIPEPGTLLLVAGGAGLAWIRRRYPTRRRFEPRPGPRVK